MYVTYIVPETGGYEIINGGLMMAHPTVNKINRLLSQRIGQDIRNPEYGNPLITTRNLTVNDIDSGINYCLQPLITTGEIASLSIISRQKSYYRGRWSVKLLVQLPSISDPLPIEWGQPKDLT